MEKLVFPCNLIQKVKLLYVCDSLLMKWNISRPFFLFLMIPAYRSWKSKIQHLKILNSIN